MQALYYADIYIKRVGYVLLFYTNFKIPGQKNNKSMDIFFVFFQIIDFQCFILFLIVTNGFGQTPFFWQIGK